MFELKWISISYATLSSCMSLQKSSICRAAVHAGVIKNDVGGYIDVMPVDKRKHYVASYQNGIFSERYGMPDLSKTYHPHCNSIEDSSTLYW